MSHVAFANTEVMGFPVEEKMHAPIFLTTIPDPMHILLAEDDASDIMLTEGALNDANVDYELHTLGNGADVLPYLRGQGKYCDDPKPQLLMLDLSMPGKDGFEVLAELSAKPERFSDLPIIILTGDKHCAFLKNSYNLNIVAYLTKPCSAEKIQRAFAVIRKTKT